jgi:WD40 repeat protein
VVAVVAETEFGTKVGSGYLLDAAHILTAWHCTVDETEQTAVALRVKRAEGENSAAVTVIESTSKLDMALLEVIGDPPWGAGLPGGPIVFGRLDRERDGQISCDALGFPRWQADGGFRDVAEVHGPVYLTEGRERGRAVLRSPVLDSVTADGGPAWAGFSGAAVFHGGLLIGVVIEHHSRQGASALQFRPVGAIADDGGDAERRLARVLGIDSPAALRLVIAGSAPAPLDASVAASPGWSLSSDREKGRHWEPRARGASKPGEQVWWFRGRQEALNRITGWLDRDRASASPHVLVVTGAPGAGKSAVLARVVTTADREFRASMPPDDAGVMAAVGSVSCAVHASGKTALEVAAEIAAAAAVDAPEKLEDLVLAVSKTSTEKAPGRFTVLIDAVDEAVSTAQARAIIDSVILPLAETCPGVRVIAGTRARDDEGDLIGRFGRALDLVDLDAPEYFRKQDLVDYALACLQLRGGEGPYADEGAARPLAETIAGAAGRNFLVAGLVARDHGLHDGEAADPARLEPVTSVRAALERYLERLPGIGVLPARRLLTALAFAEAPGLTAALWKAAVEAFPQGGVNEAWPVQVHPGQLDAFARSSAANFLVETQDKVGKDGSGSRSYQLFHQALGEALLAAREELVDRAVDDDALAQAFLRDGLASGWDRAPDYLLRSLPAHAARAGMVDDLLADDAYLLYADLPRIIQVADRAVSPAARSRARLLGLTPEAVTSGPAERVALFSVTEALDGLGTAYREAARRGPYRAQWATAQPRHENLTLQGHQGMVEAMCAVEVGDRTLLATGDSGGTVRLWDPADGSQIRVVQAEQYWVRAVCAVEVEGRTLLATGGSGGTVRLWDPSTGSQVRVLDSYLGSTVMAICTVQARGRTLLAAGGSAGPAALWDLSTGSVRHLRGHRNGVTAVCAVTFGDRTLLATCGNEDGDEDIGMVRLWDSATGTQIRTLQAHQRRVDAVCAVEVGDRTLLATCGNDDRDEDIGMVRLWDPADGTQFRTLKGHQGRVEAVCAVEVEGRTLLASAGADRTVRLWDPADGTQIRTLQAHQRGAKAVCAVEVGDRTLLATCGNDGTARLWDLRAFPPHNDLQACERRAEAVCAVEVSGRTLLATGGTDGMVELRDLVDGSPARLLEGHEDRVEAVCVVRAENRSLLASGSLDGTVRLWDPVDGSCARVLQANQGEVDAVAVHAVCAVEVDGRTLLATGGSDDTVNGDDDFSRDSKHHEHHEVVQMWDPASGSLVSVLGGRMGLVLAVCAVQVGDRTLLAISGHDGAVRLRDPADGSQIRALQANRDTVYAVCAVDVGGRALLATGGDDRAVRLWDPTDGSQISVLQAHEDRVRALCAVDVGGRAWLATGGDDRAVRVWDPADGRCVVTVPVHHAVMAITSVADSLAVGLEAGLIVIKFEADFLA